jgi:hypothetical protein
VDKKRNYPLLLAFSIKKAEDIIAEKARMPCGEKEVCPQVSVKSP